MRQQLWKKWTIDKPAAFGDLLWDVFVVQLAALLDRLTWRKVIAIIPLVRLVIAYAHRMFRMGLTAMIGVPGNPAAFLR